MPLAPLIPLLSQSPTAELDRTEHVTTVATART
jgi:hypothetical protein